MAPVPSILASYLCASLVYVGIAFGIVLPEGEMIKSTNCTLRVFPGILLRRVLDRLGQHM